MPDIIQIMLPALVACLILTSIHTYLGLHVVSRGVIFVDLALAQIAALGSTFAFLLGFDPRSQSSYLYSLAFTFLGAAIFSLSRLKDKRIPQEALIGIVFAVSSSAAILIADRAPQGAEHVEEMLTGSILWVGWGTIFKTTIIYSVIGLFHFLYRRKFLLISMDPDKAEAEGMAVRWWDFLFYISFGFVITSSVAIAGVLLVFSFLIIPSVIGMLYSNRIVTRLMIGWVSGTLVSMGGLFLSYRFDLPSGPAVVCTFGLFLLLAALLRYVSLSRRRLPALARVGAATGFVLLLLGLAFQFRPSIHPSGEATQSKVQRLQGILDHLAEGGAPESRELEFLMQNTDYLESGLSAGTIKLDQRAVRRMGELNDKALLPVLKRTSEISDRPWTRFYAASARLQLGDPPAFHDLVHLLSQPVPVFLKAQVIERVRQVTGQDFGYDVTGTEAHNEAALNRIEAWWHENAQRLQWDQEKGSLVVKD